MKMLEYDEEADAIYVQISSKKTLYSIEISSNIILDISENNKAIGVEILEASKMLSDLFQSKITKKQIAQVICTPTEDETLNLHFQLDKSRATLAIPMAYQSPILTVMG